MYLATAIISVVLICHESNKVFNYSFASQLVDLFPNFAISIIMLVVVFVMEENTAGDLFMALEIMVGGIVYLICSSLTRNVNLKYVMGVVNRVLRK